jgi:hypothetical protein
LIQQEEATLCCISTSFGFSAILKFISGDNHAFLFGSESTFIQAF